MNGYINSIQTLGTLDGPGVRFVLFMQGCPLRCVYCHNPETWEYQKGKTMTADEVIEKVLRYKNYFGADGGITVSGGEPLVQAEFVYELFRKCRDYGINTALDTSGCFMNDTVKNVLSLTDTVLLDYKMITPEDYIRYTKCTIDSVNTFLEYLQENDMNVWLRHVVVKDITDSDENALFLKKLKEKYTCIKKIELLPFHKMCVTKYDEMGIDFPLKDVDETAHDKIEELYSLIGQI